MAEPAPSVASPNPAYRIIQTLHRDDFNDSLTDWSTELELGGQVSTRDGRLDIDVPGGATVWFKPRIDGPVMIEYEATAISTGGANDRVSDLNCFWMARDTRSPDDLFATRRNGKFADYDRLQTYYVGQGGNSNTTTRFRRYVGEQNNRPLLPGHDLRDRSLLLRANVPQKIQLIASGSTVQYYRDGECIFDFHDTDPYTRGGFGLRTTKSHLSVRHFRVYRLAPA